MKKICMLILSVNMLALTLGFTQEITEIDWVTPEWEDYTNKDGTGFYNEMMSRIFESKNITLNRIYVPWKRALFMVEYGNADMTGTEDPNDTYLQSTYPIFKSIEAVWFKKNIIKEWKGLESLKERNGIWYQGYLEFLPEKLKPFLQGREVASRAQALKIVLNGRNADYYYDNRDQLLKTIESSILSFNPDDFQLEIINVGEVFWMFSKSERGEKIRDMFDQGFKELYCSGELLQMYEKWGLEVEFPVDIINCGD